MLHNRKKESLVIFLSIATLAMIIDFIAFAAIRKPSGLALALSLHTSLIVVLLVWVGYLFYKRKNRRFNILLLVMTAATGPFGAGLCLLTVLVYSYCSIKSSPPSEWISSLFAEEDEESDLSERIALGLDNISSKSEVEPFLDILNCGTMMQKQMAIAKIARYFTPAFAPFLLQAAQDQNAAVRVQAAAALAKIERHFMAQCMNLEKTLKGSPYSDSSWLKLAKVYEDYASAGLLDENSLSVLREKAIKIYESCLLLADNQEVRMRLARLYLNQDQADKAHRILEDTIEAQKDTHPVIVFWYIESLFRLKKFGEVRRMAKHYVNELAQLDKFKYGVELERTMSLWEPAGRIEGAV